MPVSMMSEIDARVLAFERAMSGDSDPEFDAFLPPPGDPSRGPTVCELARVDLELRWSRGERPDLDSYLDRYPELTEPSALAEVAFEDYRQRLLAGEKPDRDHYASRYSVEVEAWPGPEAVTKAQDPSTRRHTAELGDGPPTVAVLVRPRTDYEQVLSDVSVEVREEVEKARALPETGETVLGFRLTRELGRGAFGRVFLAEQKDLADRPVAVKFSTTLAGEIRALARLQHTNIVPVYSAHSGGTSLQALCMPYFGGTTLGKALVDVIVAGTDRTGKVLADAVRRGQSAKIDRAGPLDLYDRSTFADTILWIGERLADALAHSHDRGILHRDIKPANVLLADDGQPMLLDFNLAIETSTVAADKARVGGTLPYMAPEQLGAFGGGPRVPPDPRADIYSLGVVLYEAFARQPAFPIRSGPTHSVIKAMHEDRIVPPPRLMPMAADVTPAVEAIVLKCLAPNPAERYQSAADLRDDLARQRTHQPLRHTREPSRKERLKKWARRNRHLVSPAALTAYAAALLLVGTAVGVRLSLSARAERQDRDRLTAIHDWEEFQTTADLVKQAAGSPRGSAEVLRLSGPALDKVTNDAVTSRLPAADRDRLKSEVGEIAFLAARAAALTKHDASLAERLDRLADASLSPEARTVFDPEPADGSRGSFLRACDLAVRGRYIDALPLVAALVAKNPDDFGGWYLKAKCHDTLGQYEDARAAYATAAALRPKSARTFAARADLALRHQREFDQAKADLDRALALEPTLMEARFNRALALRRIGENAAAVRDLDALLDSPDAPTRAYFLRADAKADLGDKAGAAADRALGMKERPRDPASFVVRGLEKAEADPEAALRDFQAAETLDPNYPEALVNQAWVYGEKLNRQTDALAAVDRLLAKYPDHQNARGGRAVYLARLGKPKEAIAEAKVLLDRAPQAAAYYQAACVYALVSGNDSTYKAEGIRLVAAALLRGFGHDLISSDSDLDPLRKDAKFRTLAEGVRVMTESEAKK